MRNLLRNPEVRHGLVLHLLLLAAVAAAWLWHPSFGLFTLGLWAVYLFFYLVSAARRYRQMAELSQEIDQLLHGDHQMDLTRYEEGELAILHSQLVKMTVRLREQQLQLQQDKVHLADSLADISHQIRTPLTSINLLVSRLSQPQLPPQRHQQLIAELQQLLGRIDWLVVTLLKLSRLDAGTATFQARPIPMEHLLQTAAAPLLVPMELRGITLQLEGQGIFNGDEAWTAEALGNIIKNCMEHTPEGGCVTVQGSENALYSQITVTDTGCGIAPEDLPHIFQRFYKGKNSDDKSFGIGLALARQVVTAQNGTIKAANRPQGGAEFQLRFYKGTV